MAIDVDSLYRTHGPMVLRRCRRLLREEAKAVDAMQDVFVEILRRKETLDDRAPAGLLLTTATNVCLNKLRTMRRRPEDAEEELIHQVASFGTGESESAEERTLARRFLDRLFQTQPESTRLIAVLHYVDRLTLEEVAAEVDMSVSGVRKRLRALQAAVPAVKGAA
jgi:RNA polymerase sigma-70 factor (ECF subfamily)